ncbi:hypothetical protein [Paenibacillus allorhizoplanae]|uniref:hypothetical protein n=1 Tax=Paenibacillus allorhizoplanae TaxID=2905648 RepID=UPI001F284CCB|nr:hypothetical protein [Paenibacillus allorhizoplanae]
MHTFAYLDDKWGEKVAYLHFSERNPPSSLSICINRLRWGGGTASVGVGVGVDVDVGVLLLMELIMARARVE